MVIYLYYSLNCVAMVIVVRYKITDILTDKLHNSVSQIISHNSVFFKKISPHDQVEFNHVVDMVCVIFCCLWSFYNPSSCHYFLKHSSHKFLFHYPEHYI